MTTFSTATQHKARAAAMPFIMLTVLIDMVSVGLIVPVLPALVGEFTGSQADTAFWYGAVAFAFGLANFFGAPILGALSDRYGRRPILLLGFCGLALNFFATAFSTALWMLIVVRLIGGAMQANAAVCNAYVADITQPEQRAKRFGMIGAMFGVGFIIGPVMGGLLGAINLRLPFIVAGSLALINLIYGYFVLPESLPAERRRSFSWKSANPLSSLQALSRLKTVGPLVGVVACSGLAQFILFTIWMLYTNLKFDWGPLQNGQALAAVGIMSVLVQGVLLNLLLKRFSPQRLAIIGLLSSTAAYLLWGMANHGWMMYAIIFANIFGPTVTAVIQSIISGATDSHNQGQTLGAVSSLNSLMAVIAPVIGAPLLGAVSNLPKGDWRIGAPFYFCAALQCASLVLAYLHFRRQRQARTFAYLAQKLSSDATKA
ncbi:Tetracycline-efflux transporter [Collimonas arenae]|uniref:Tetracycline-efflux transporter n=1 Tax=Collimonas arenae TaxID=279058 RepID=A0A0A1F6Q7_9BURK|nr:TCR/Tet family MFS transporter [Collimonas arenae]AIY39490.1 Tetracycline-efflux transporter [Collimonas arenae]